MAKVALKRACEWLDENADKIKDPVRWFIYDLMVVTSNSEGRAAYDKFKGSSKQADINRMKRI